MADMRTDTPQPIRLTDYRPPAYLIDEVHLDFALAPTASRVRARLTIRRNGKHAEPLRLDGVRLKPLVQMLTEALEAPSAAERERGLQRLGDVSLSRAVGQALGANPIPIIVPCHRVVAGNGIGGYGGGLPLKRALLAIEGVRA